ncbi:hypothetical protein [Alkaliphilus serpentinus]|uniref:Uncharacterized protein n=1 Tax=Alkaliphilus serpentinus TaxID=1482731 RepID=A0A833M7P8_9FIRM|nr:hypothetical protein [Alkaliphilus serpentinus]KAB3529042.1 hypothetical protein F8153_10320 [Alkaliphilus serpentinus]
MDLVCPVCNCMASYLISCPDCGGPMEDSGVVQDFYDDYSPYLDRSITDKVDGAAEDECMHLFYCPSCDSKQRLPIKRVKI